MKRETLLAILQQSEYDFYYFKQWYHRHKNEQELLIKPEKWTVKLRLINFISRCLFFLPTFLAIKYATLLLLVPESIGRVFIYQIASLKLAAYKKNGLKVVVVAGSYAKTSTKHLLFNLLRDETKLLVTPSSINIKLGIAQIICNNLAKTHQLFVVELGEYKLGDIQELLNYVQPHWGILTPITIQHLERMGSFANILLTFKELLNFFKQKNELAAVIVHQSNQKHFSKDYPELAYYPSDKIFLSKVSVSRQGTVFDLTVDDSSWKKLFTPLYGEHQLENALPSFFIAQKMRLSPSKIVGRFVNLPFIERRHQPFFGDREILVLDNSYNTNPEAFATSLQLLEELSKQAQAQQQPQKIVITMGFVELGEQAAQENYKLGQLLAKKVDLLGIIDSANASDLKAGFLETRTEAEFFTGPNAEFIIQTMQASINPGATILLEGGSRELYQ